MRVFRMAAVIALLTGPAYAQMPNINLMPELKTPRRRRKRKPRRREQKAYKESLKKIPDAKASTDPWGNVRSTETPKTSAPGQAARPRPAVPRTKTDTR